MGVLSDQQFADETNTWRGGYAGASRNVHTGQQASVGEPGYMVGIPGHEVEKSGSAKVGDVQAHRQRMLSDPKIKVDREAHQGSWHVGPMGATPQSHESVTYDYSRRLLSKQFALRLGRRMLQKAIFNLKTGDDVELPAGKIDRAVKADVAAAPSRVAAGSPWHTHVLGRR